MRKREIGNEIKLFCGDCLEVMRSIPNKSVQMVLCDLPYGTTAIEWDKQIPFEPMWKQYERIVIDNGAIVLFSAQPFTTDLINSNRKHFRYEIIWKKSMKSGFLNANKMPLRAHENILVFYKKLPIYNPIKSPSGKPERTREQRVDRSKQYGHTGLSEYNDHGLRYPTDVVEFSNWNGALFGKTENATKHPTQKPIDLCEYLILTYTNPGNTVLDNCMGSGTTGVACVRTGRSFIGIEIDPSYYAIAEKRIADEQQRVQLPLESETSTQGDKK